jgi:predicted nucleic acid-binding protein
MGNEVILPDTCVWIDYFKGRDTAFVRTLSQALATSEIVTCGVVMYELFQGIRSDSEYTLVQKAFGSLRFIEMNKNLWLSAAQLSTSLRKSGVTIPASDIQIATLALQHRLTILTIDQHFKQVPDLLIKEAV